VFTGLLIRGVVVVAVILACATGLTACFGLLVAADYFAFATILPPFWAALAAAGTALLFCLLVVIAGVAILSGMKRRMRRTMPARIAALVGEVFGKEFADVTERYPGRSIAIALAAGFALGFSPKLRDAIFSFLRR
jgi:hypothetical protein